MSRANTNSRNAYNRAYQSARYAELKAAGLCRWCGKHPAKAKKDGTPGCRCESCAAKANVKARENMRRKRPAWRALGVCIVCGCREAIKGQTWCGVCAERHCSRKTA